MKLTCFYDERCAGNPYFQYIFKSICEKLTKKYPEYNIEHTHPPDFNDCYGCPGGQSNFQILNPDNYKTILLSFWDNGMNVFMDGHGWDKYIITQYIGGLGMNMTSKQIKEAYDITHIPFQYPLGVPNSYDYIDEIKTQYNFDKKLKKAIFIGNLYGFRSEISNILKNHPLIEIIGSDSIYHGKDYFKKISEYALGLSFNGNGEICLRDFEYMGLNIPVIRSELLTQFHNLLIPGVHYVKLTDPISSYEGIDPKQFANHLIDTAETLLNDKEKLTYIANNGGEYFEKCCKPDQIVDLFFDLINIEKLE